MKVLIVFLLTLADCHTNKPGNPGQSLNQEGDVQVQTCSRGCYQFILKPTGETKQRFYVTNFPDSLTKFVLDAHNNQKDLRVLYSGKQLNDKHMVQGLGPDDRPTPLYELPGFQLEQIRRLPGKSAN